MRIAGCAIAAVLFVVGCAQQSTMRLKADTVCINVSTTPIYGSLEPERLAMLLAAEETIKSGYDKFIIVNGQSGFRSDVLGVIPEPPRPLEPAGVIGGIPVPGIDKLKVW